MNSMDEAVFNHRCPGCHRIVERELLFSIGCPVCGWKSPIRESSETRRGFQELHEVNGSVDASLVEVFDEKERIVVLAEMPGFAEEEIEVKALNRLLIISADGLTQRYHKRIMLPCPTVGKARTKYKNGVLEIVLRKGFYGR